MPKPNPYRFPQPPTVPQTRTQPKRQPSTNPQTFHLGYRQSIGILASVSTPLVPLSGIVDKSRPIDPVQGFLLAVHFGEQLRRLRIDRGLSQDGLAAAAGVSSPTIRKAEKRADCAFFGTTAVLIFRALDRQAPLSPKDRETYARATKIMAFMDEAPPAPAPTNPDLDTVALYTQRLFEEAGAVKLKAALEALAAAWDIDLPPAAHRLPALKQRVQAHGVDATIYTPTNSATPPPPKPTPRTKSA